MVEAIKSFPRLFYVHDSDRIFRILDYHMANIVDETQQRKINWNNIASLFSFLIIQ